MDLKAELKGTERHLKGYNYCGPQTKLKLRASGKYEQMMRGAGKKLVGKAPYNKPVNALDAACKRHDYAFSKKGLPASQVRKADNDLIKAARSIRNNIGAPKQLRKDARKVQYGIRGKVLAEDVGILRKGSFSQGGEKQSKLGQVVKKKLKEKAKEVVIKKGKDILKKAIIKGIKGKA